MFKRSVRSLLERFAGIYKVICITGPRQSGKTTIAKSFFPHLPYVSMEDFDNRVLAKQDPRQFLAQYEEGAIFDEVQNSPELLSYLQGIVDASPRTGRYIITGSQNFALNQQITQSLAGRVGMITLLPLSLTELNESALSNDLIVRGSYPGLHSFLVQPNDFYPSYIHTYVERDVRQLKNITNLDRFHQFLKLCATRVGQLINFSSLAQDCGISTTTAKGWFTLLKASYITFTLPPFYKNFGKRHIKMPKLYFYDTGLASFLLGIHDGQQLEKHPFKGALFENFALLEVLKGRFSRGQMADLYFWRDSMGHEIDLITDSGGLQVAEIKAGKTFDPKYLKNIHYFLNMEKEEEVKSHLIYAGRNGNYGGTELVPIARASEIFNV